MPLPLTVSCFSKIQISFTFLVPAHPGSPGQGAVKWVCVRVCPAAACLPLQCTCVCASDILGDGTIHPWQLIRAPVWLKGYSGNELQRTARQLAMQGRFLREMFPSKYHMLTKNLNYQFKKLNRRQRTRWWGGYKRFSRIDQPRRRYWSTPLQYWQLHHWSDIPGRSYSNEFIRSLLPSTVCWSLCLTG